MYLAPGTDRAVYGPPRTQQWARGRSGPVASVGGSEWGGPVCGGLSTYYIIVIYH